jgi:predicted transcriptional regulator of viral defense system
VDAVRTSSSTALTSALGRLVRKRRLYAPRRGFYVIVPTEYRDVGAPPVPWFIDDLMRFEERPYYVGLLSAADLLGAAHHAPQRFQIVTNRVLRPFASGRERVEFSMNLAAASVPVVDRKTATGTMRVSTPAATAFDLVRYVQDCGGIDHVATVISELAEAIPPIELAALVPHADAAVAQRLGWLFAHLGRTRLADSIDRALVAARWWVPLTPGVPEGGHVRDPRWRVVVNSEIEVEG